MVYNALLSANQRKVIDYLFRHFDNVSNLRGLARRLKITPMGIKKILSKLENESLVTKKTIGNGIFYKLNFHNEKTEDIVKYVLKSQQAPNPFVAVRAEDVARLRNITDLAVFFGSVLTKAEKANDIDLLLVFAQTKYKEVQTGIKTAESISTKPIHLLTQTKEDLKKNLHKPDPVVKEILHTGHIIWGYNLLYEVVCDEANTK